jgi:hypothetical protein
VLNFETNKSVSLDRWANRNPVGPNSQGYWPTPTTGDHSTRFAQGGMPLGMAARSTWPTPTANEDAAGRPGSKMQKMLGNHPDIRGDLTGGALNPTWVEWLMGFPLGWTDLGPSATRSSRRSSK